MPDIPTSALVSAATAASKVKPWATVRRHNRLALQEYEDLNTWALDDLQNEARNLEAVKSDMIERGMLHSGAYGAGLRRVRDEYARRWRDRRRASDRRLEELREAEGATVKSWRWIRKDPFPTNSQGSQLATITRAWESEEVRLEAVANEVQAVAGG